MSESYIRKTECYFCGEEIYNHKRHDHLPCEGVEPIEEPQETAKATVPRGGR